MSLSTIAATGHYRNPVIPGFHPDPSICRVGDTFYLVTSSFEYFPGIPVFESRDLVSWHQIGFCLTTPSQLDLVDAAPSQGVFAPTIRWNNGLFWVTATNVSGRGHFIVHAADPAGPWSEPVWVDQDGIDPSLFFEDGIAYFQSNIEPEPGGEHEAEPSFQRGIQQSIVDPLTGQRLSPSRLLWTGSGGRFPEAPHIYRRGEYYYLLVSEGGTERGHMITIARAKNIWGPFEGCPRNPVLSHRSTASPIQSVGHADLVELDDGTWWAVVLGTRPKTNWHHLGRETFLVPMLWDDEGWPILGTEGRVDVEHPRPSLPVEPIFPSATHTDFTSPLGWEWNTLRIPHPDQISLTERPGWLVQHGTAATSGDPLCVLIARRLQHHHAFAAATLDARDIGGGIGGAGEAGLIVRIDEVHHAEVAVVVEDGRRHVVYRRSIGSLVSETRYACPNGLITLRAEVDDDFLTFAYDSPEGAVILEPRHETRYISTEIAGGFTGAYVGLYVSGEGSTAAWDSFDYAS